MPGSNKAVRRGKARRPKAKYTLPPVEATEVKNNLEKNFGTSISYTLDTASGTTIKQFPGYFAFTKDVWQTIWAHRSTFWRLILLYALISGLISGVSSQSLQTDISGLLRDAGSGVLKGDMSRAGEAGELLLLSVTGAGDSEAGNSQQIVSGLLFLIVWMTTLWLLRAFLAGQSPRLRDGFYNSSAPLVPTLIVGFMLVLQLIPAAIAAIAISAAIPSGIIGGGIVMVLFWGIMLLLVLLSLYLISGTVIALVVVTLPGMTPLGAMRTAKELVSGRRLFIVLRIVWMLLVSTLIWVIIMLALVVLDLLLKGVLVSLEWLPIIPLGYLFVGSISTVWIVSYSYLLYRKVVDIHESSA